MYLYSVSRAVYVPDVLWQKQKFDDDDFRREQDKKRDEYLRKHV